MIRAGILSSQRTAAPSLALRLGLCEVLARPASDLEAQPIVVVAEAASLEHLGQPLAEIDVLVAAPSTSEWFDAEAFFAAPGGPPILWLSDDPGAARLLAGRSQAPWGLLSPAASQEQIQAAIRALYAGLNVFSPPALRAAFDRPSAAGRGDLDPLVEPLTARETEILSLLAQGLSNKQIAARLVISEHTVKFHVSSIYPKLGAANRAEAVRYGMQRGLVAL